MNAAGGPLNDQKGKGLSIAALVLAGVALLLCWVPIVNNVVFFLGLVAVILAIVALIIAIKSQGASRGMAIAALVVGALSMVGVLATQALYSSILGGVRDAISGGGDGASSTGGAPGSNPTTQPTDSDAPTPGSAKQPLALGVPANVGGEYQVAVTSVLLNANAEIAAANQFNDPPTGQFVLVKLNVTYMGQEEGTPWIDLSETFVGTDARQYDESACRATVPEQAFSVPTLEKGGSAEFQVCMDVPPGAIDGGKIFIEERMSFRDKSRTYWAIR